MGIYFRVSLRAYVQCSLLVVLIHVLIVDLDR